MDITQITNNFFYWKRIYLKNSLLEKSAAFTGNIANIIWKFNVTQICKIIIQHKIYDSVNKIVNRIELLKSHIFTIFAFYIRVVDYKIWDFFFYIYTYLYTNL